MTLKERLIRFADKQDRKEEELAAGRRAFLRNRSYHSYFEGYTEFTVSGKNGKPVIQRVYTGKYYRQMLSPVCRILVRLLYLAGISGAVACFMFSSMAQISGNMSPFVTVPQAICIPTLFWVGLTVLTYLFSPVLLKIYDFKSTSGALKRSAKWAAAAQALTALMLTVYSLFTGGFADCIRQILLLVAAGILLSGMLLLETRIPYETVANPDSERYDGTVIE